MFEVSIPTYRDLLFPTLQAVDDLGGSAHKSEIDAKVIELAGVTGDQLAVEYPKGGSDLKSSGWVPVWFRAGKRRPRRRSANRDSDLLTHDACGAYNRAMKKFLLVFLVLALLGFTAKKMMDNA